MQVIDLIDKLCRFNLDAEIVIWDAECDEVQITHIDTNEDTDNNSTDSHVYIHLDCEIP